ncbi:hypothetical protein COB57_04190 [Candidatus Peregrinibacteria bacterium]|nr:MAG: hypothetical protein COB57_04190 [Candidatus Peregrinibacteria bacterium]
MEKKIPLHEDINFAEGDFIQQYDNIKRGMLHAIKACGVFAVIAASSVVDASDYSYEKTLHSRASLSISQLLEMRNRLIVMRQKLDSPHITKKSLKKIDKKLTRYHYLVSGLISFRSLGQKRDKYILKQKK